MISIYTNVQSAAGPLHELPVSQLPVKSLFSTLLHCTLTGAFLLFRSVPSLLWWPCMEPV